MKRIGYLLLTLIIAAFAGAAFVACNKDFTITYYISETAVYRTDIFSENGGVTLPPEPVDEANYFAGWYLDLAFEKEFKAENALDYVVDGKISVYAKWIPKTQAFRVKFVDFDGSIIKVGGKDYQTIENGESATAPANPVRDGYYFTGWSQSFAEITQDLDIIAGYKLILKVIAEDKSIQYGDAAPVFSLKYSTVLGANLSPVLSGDAVFSCQYSVGDSIGSYQIDISGLASDEYHLNFVSGTLTVNRRILMVTADNKSVTYGGAPPVLSASVTGLLDGHSFEGYSLSVNYTQGDAPGSYEITVSAPAQVEEYITESYTVNCVAGILTVNKLQYNGLTHGNISLEYAPGKTLADLNAMLDNNWRWADDSALLGGGTYTAEILYNDNSAIYDDFSFLVTLVVSKTTLRIAGTAEAVLSGSGETLLCSQVPAGVYWNDILIEGVYAYGDTDYNKGITQYVSFSFAGNECYLPASATVLVKIKTVDINGTYYTIEDAISAGKNGETAIVKANTDFCSDAGIISMFYNSPAYYTIKAGFVLLLPYDNTFSASNEDMYASGSHIVGVVPYIEVSAIDISLIIFGKLMVNAKTARWNGVSSNFPQQGHTSDAFSQLRISGVSITVKNGGSLIANGLILDDGNAGTGIRIDYIPSNNIVAESGAVVQDLLSIHDHRAATSLNSIYKNIFPYNQYTLHNIEANIKIEYGANYNVRWTIIFSQNTNERNTGVATFIGNNQGAIYQMTSGYAEKTFNKYTARNTIDFYGDVITNDFSVSVKIVPIVSVVTIDVSTAGLFFPIFGAFTINIKSGIFTVNSNIKLLPGAKLNIESGAKLIISGGKQLAVYDENQYTEIWSAAYSGGSISVESYPISGDGMLPLSSGFWYKDEGYGWDFAASDKATVTVKGELIAYGAYGGPITVAESGSVEFLSGTSVEFKETTSATATKIMIATVPEGVLNMPAAAAGKIAGNANNDFYFEDKKTILHLTV